MSDSSNMNQQMDDSAVVELTGKIMVVAIIVLFVVVVFVFFLHLYAKWFWYRQEHDGAAPARRRQELAVVTALRHGLDPSVLKSIPVVKFAAKDFKDGLECAVCLSEVSDGEKARMLPKCNHGFHVECIDMWFQSHSTCPLCRNPISNPSSSNSAESSLESILQTPPQDHSNSNLTESLNFPTNVLFWGNETQVSTLGSSLEEDNSSAGPTTTTTASSSSSSSNSRPDGALVIDIPSQMNEEEDQNPKSPMPSRMRSLKRLLSRNRLINPCSPRNVEVVEHMGRGQT